MVQKESHLVPADNSGALDLKIFHLVGSTGKKRAGIGDLVICAVKRAIPGGQVKKGDIVTAVIVRLRKEKRRADGSYVRFGDNAAVLVKGATDTTPLATRIFGPIARELRGVKGKDFSKILSLAPEVV